MGIRCADHVTPLYPQKLALTSPTGGGPSVGIVRLRTKATELKTVKPSVAWYFVLLRQSGFPGFKNGHRFHCVLNPKDLIVKVHGMCISCDISDGSGTWCYLVSTFFYPLWWPYTCSTYKKIYIYIYIYIYINPLNAELNPICHLLSLLGVHHILHISRIRVNPLNTVVTVLYDLNKDLNS